MAKVSLSTIKNWFRTALKPTQSQFWDTWDSFWHKDDSIPTSSITGLDAYLSQIPTPEQLALLQGPVTVVVSGANTYQLPAGKLLEKVIATPTGSQLIKLGTTVGGEEIFSETIDSALVAQVDWYAPALTTLHFTATNTTFKLLIR